MARDGGDGLLLGVLGLAAGAAGIYFWQTSKASPEPTGTSTSTGTRGSPSTTRPGTGPQRTPSTGSGSTPQRPGGTTRQQPGSGSGSGSGSGQTPGGGTPPPPPPPPSPGSAPVTEERTEDLGNGWARTWYSDGSHQDWQIPLDDTDNAGDSGGRGQTPPETGDAPAPGSGSGTWDDVYTPPPVPEPVTETGTEDVGNGWARTWYSDGSYEDWEIPVPEVVDEYARDNGDGTATTMYVYSDGSEAEGETWDL